MLYKYYNIVLLLLTYKDNIKKYNFKINNLKKTIFKKDEKI